MATVINSLLLSLPAELRNYILTLTLQGCRILTVSRNTIDKARLSPALLQVNRQLRRECMPLFYGINKFCICPMSSTFCRDELCWLRHSSAVEAGMRNLQILAKRALVLKRERISDTWKAWECARDPRLIEEPWAWCLEKLRADELEAVGEIFAPCGGGIVGQ